MESVEGHLCGGLSHGLGTDTSNHLTRVDDSSSEDGADVKNQLIEGSGVKPVFHYNFLRAQ